MGIGVIGQESIVLLRKAFFSVGKTLIEKLFTESLILAQDERWRRA
jgi:hypothetical protein